MNLKKISEFLLNFKKKYIYLVMFVLISTPLILKVTQETYETKEVKSIYQRVEEIYQHNKENPEDKLALFISVDFAPSTKAECDPMMNAMLRHAFLRDIPVLGWAGVPQGIDYGLERFNTIAKEYNKKYGEDYIYLGYAYPFLQAALAFGTDVRIFASTDYYGKDTYDNYPIMEKFNNYNQLGLFTSITGTSLAEGWIQYANGLFNQDVAAGVTAVNASRLYPFLQSGQLVGMMGGLKGAAEYEQMVERLEKKEIKKDIKNYLSGLYKNYEAPEDNPRKYDTSYTKTELLKSINSRKMARQGMAAQKIAHFYVIALIIIANIGYLLKKRYESRR